MRTTILCGILMIVEPFTSNDTYVCPDCGSDVKVGARSCPECGPFRPMQQEDDERDSWNAWEEGQEDGTPNQPAFPFHSITTYTDSREILERSRRPAPESIPVISFVDEDKTRNPRAFLVILIILTVFSAALAAWRLFQP